MEQTLLDWPLAAFGGHTVTLGAAALAGLALLCLLLLLRRRPAGGQDGRIEALIAAQTEMAGRVHSMTELLGGRQAELARAVGERLDGVSQRVSRTLAEGARDTGEGLARLAERLAVIDRAQGEIRALAGEVVRLQDILADKQARGIFGQGRMEAIVRDALPPGAYLFQATLSNGKRPDCLIPMPNGAPSLAIDAKFPLESWTALRAAEGEDARLYAGQRLRRDMDVHIRAIAEKYLVPGETQDTAFLFVPSESIFADLHERFPEVIQKAHRARVVIVSPSLLVLSIQVVQALLKDHRMREEAGRIRQEVGFLAEDLQRLDTRVAALRTHFGQTGRDVDAILTSTEKLMKRGARITGEEIGSQPSPADGAVTNRSRESDRSAASISQPDFSGHSGE